MKYGTFIGSFPFKIAVLSIFRKFVDFLGTSREFSDQGYASDFV